MHRLQSNDGRRLVNGELVDVKEVRPSGEILLDDEDVSPENLKKARAVVAAFKRDLAKRKAKPTASDAEPGLPRNPAFGYARFGGPYLKRP